MQGRKMKNKGATPARIESYAGLRRLNCNNPCTGVRSQHAQTRAIEMKGSLRAEQRQNRLQTQNSFKSSETRCEPIEDSPMFGIEDPDDLNGRSGSRIEISLRRV